MLAMRSGSSSLYAPPRAGSLFAAITIFILLALFPSWNEVMVRRRLLIGLASYFIMRVWSGLFFIREMLALR